ncbi:Protein TOMM-22 [Aphelenchoides avenae]|nr:Protein TOMM-22 [Aphelenchus avenae]
MSSTENYWDDVPDDELEETLLERLEGLKEMFPESLRNGVSSTVDWGCWATQSFFTFSKSAVWVAATTSAIMFLPYIVEKELSDLEKTQIAQQRQMLLGPSAAIAEANKQKAPR